MTTAEYRQHPACNFSSLKALLTSPAHYQAALAHKAEETEAMRLGTLVHGITLEGKEPHEMYAFKPDGLNLATKDGKEWRAAQTLEIMGNDKLAAALAMRESVMANVHAAHILSISPERETPLFSTIQGAPCKCLIDAHGTDGVEWWIADLKTTDDASPDAFARKVANFHYDLQAELYSEILSRHHQIETRPYWLWIAVEKTPPYTCAVYNANEWRESGEAKLDRVLQSWKECTASGEWPQPWQGINQLPKPKWA
jgi:hypothetical protein